MLRKVSAGVVLPLACCALASIAPQARAQIILLPCPDCPPEVGLPVPVESGHFSEFLEPGDEDVGQREVALFDAIRRGELAYVQAIAAAGGSLTNHDENGLMPLAWAAQFGRLHILNYLLARGVPRNPADHYGFTPLMWAAQQGQASAVEALLRAGANPRVRTRQGVDALALARVGRHVRVENLLLDALAGRLKPATPKPSPTPAVAPSLALPPTPRPLPSLDATPGPTPDNAPVMPQWPGSGALPVPPQWPASGSIPVMPQLPGSGALPVPPQWPASGSIPVMPQWPGSGALPVPPQWPASGSIPVMPQLPASTVAPVSPVTLPSNMPWWGF